MDMELRNEGKKRGFGRFLKSFKYSIEGLKYTIRYEQSILVMAIAMLVAVIIGLILKLAAIEWVFMALAIGIVLAIELINTSIEATIDLLSPNVHPLAKIAKDTASAAVFICSMMAVAIGLIIFIPKIIELIKIG